ncbi:MAG: hypothetical protein ABI024_01150 [Vicinamibacterales bacterium]
MKRLLLASVLTLGGALPSFASSIAITLTVPPELIGKTLDPWAGAVVLGYELNGIVLNGQSLSLDLKFGNDIVARVAGFGGFYSILFIQTNADTFPGLAGDAEPVCDYTATHCYTLENNNPPIDRASGFRIATDGTPLGSAVATPTYMDIDGSLSLGLFPGYDRADMSGVHYELRLPTTGYQITGGSLRLVGVSQFGTAAQLPDPASALLLFGMGLTGIIAVRRRLR